jgi:hypothetical protein
VAGKQWVRIGVGVLAVAALTTACGGSKLTEDGFSKRVAPALTASTGPCPVAYDVAGAAKSAGIAGDVALADTDPVSAETDTSPDASLLMKQTGPAADLECDYTVGDTDVTTYALVTGKANAAVTAVLPETAYLSDDDPQTLVTPIMAAETGTAVPSPSGKAAVVHLDVQDGDGALVVGVDPADGISPTQLSDFAEALAGQLG